MHSPFGTSCFMDIGVNGVFFTGFRMIDRPTARLDMDRDGHGRSSVQKMGTHTDSFFSSSCDAVARALGGNGQSLSEKTKFFYCSHYANDGCFVAFKSSLQRFFFLDDPKLRS